MTFRIHNQSSNVSNIAGLNVVSTNLSNGDILSFNNDSWITITGDVSNGSTGPKGSDGLTGSTGIGHDGSTGLGPMGPMGPIGQSGSTTGSTGTNGSTGSTVEPIGSMGRAGSTGPPLQVSNFYSGPLNIGKTGTVSVVGTTRNDTSPFIASNWVSQNSDEQKWKDISWSPELGLFCVISGSSDVKTSPDGIIWTIHTTTGITINNDSITWSPQLGIFCIVGINDAATSSNGTGWTNHDTGFTSKIWADITWSPQLEIFCAVSSNGGTDSIMSSSNGIDWDIQLSPFSFGLLSVVWSPQLGIFCAISPLPTLNVIITSSNGINWDIQGHSNSNGLFRSITWSPELRLFATVSSNNFGSGGIMTSPNGIDWTPIFAPESNAWTSITWGNAVGMFVAVSSNRNNRVMTSIDGIIWKSVPAANTDNDWASVAYSQSLRRFVSISQSGSGTNRVMTFTGDDLTTTNLTITESTTISTSSTTGTQGMIRWDDDYLYMY